MDGRATQQQKIPVPTPIGVTPPTHPSINPSTHTHFRIVVNLLDHGVGGRWYGGWRGRTVTVSNRIESVGINSRPRLELCTNERHMTLRLVSSTVHQPEHRGRKADIVASVQRDRGCGRVVSMVQQ
jgi:hypothetical protein